MQRPWAPCLADAPTALPPPGAYGQCSHFSMFWFTSTEFLAQTGRVRIKLAWVCLNLVGLGMRFTLAQKEVPSALHSISLPQTP